MSEPTNSVVVDKENDDTLFKARRLIQRVKDTQNRADHHTPSGIDEICKEAVPINHVITGLCRFVDIEPVPDSDDPRRAEGVMVWQALTSVPGIYAIWTWELVMWDKAEMQSAEADAADSDSNADVFDPVMVQEWGFFLVNAPHEYEPPEEMVFHLGEDTFPQYENRILTILVRNDEKDAAIASINYSNLNVPSLPPAVTKLIGKIQVHFLKFFASTECSRLGPAELVNEMRKERTEQILRAVRSAGLSEDSID